jgi:hypothetical protein
VREDFSVIRAFGSAFVRFHVLSPPVSLTGLSVNDGTRLSKGSTPEGKTGYQEFKQIVRTTKKQVPEIHSRRDPSDFPLSFDVDSARSVHLEP